MTGLFGIAMVLSGILLAQPLARLFVGYDAGLMALTVSGSLPCPFFFIGFAIFGSGFFTALNDGIISFLRTLVFQVTAVLLLPVLLGIDGIWYSIVVAEFMAVLFSALFLVIKRKRFHY